VTSVATTRPARSWPFTRAHRVEAALCVAALSLASCGRDKPASELTFEMLPDTAGLTRGAPVLESFEPYRLANGAVRVKGQARLPDGTKLQISIHQPNGRVAVAMAHVYLQGGRFDSPPLLGEAGPLPAGLYRFEVLAHFNADWQGADVLRALRGGEALRGPGITRASNGRVALHLTREGKL